MRILIRTVFLFILVLFISPEVHSKCLSKEESYKKYVERTSLAQSLYENNKSIKLLKKHLECHPDKEVYYKLAVIYEYIGKHYLARLAYKKTSLESANKKEIESIAEDETFVTMSEKFSEKYSKRSRAKTFFRNAFFIVGPIASAAGLGLFIHDKAGGENSLTAQYTLMLGGMSLISGAIILNASAEDSLRVSNSYRGFPQCFRGDGGTTPDEYFIYSGEEKRVKKSLAKTYRKTGLGLMLMSLPLLAVAFYGFVDSYNYAREKYEYDEQSGGPFQGIEMLGHFFQLLSLGPGFVSFVFGSIMLAKASKWEKLSTEPSILTLNSIAPIIDPASKTYGLSMGFSF